MFNQKSQNPKVIIVADDITGACDTALEFQLVGLSVRVELAEKSKVDHVGEDVLSVSTNSRNLSREEAISKVMSFLPQISSRNVNDLVLYKKIDSTLRGHVAFESMAIVKACGYDCALIAPAFPQQRRQTIGGYQLLNGIPLSNQNGKGAKIAADHNAHIPSMLRDLLGNKAIGHLNLSSLANGIATITEEIIDCSKRENKLIVCDAASFHDLRKIAAVLHGIPGRLRVLPVGSAGLARALCGTLFGAVGQETLKQEFPDCPTFVLMGSTTEISLIQLKSFIEKLVLAATSYKLIKLAPEELLQPGKLEQVINECREALLLQKVLIVTTALDFRDVTDMYTYAKRLQLNPADVPGLIQANLVEFTKELLCGISIKIIACGGDTARCVLEGIGAYSLTIKGIVEPSIPLLHTIAPDNSSFWIVSKSGGFGDSRTLIRSFEYLNNSTI